MKKKLRNKSGDHVAHNDELVSQPHTGRNDLFPSLALLWIAVNCIDAKPRRVRRALKAQEDAVLRSIERFGFRIPLLVRRKSCGDRYEVVDGHTRLTAAQRLGAEKLPCLLVDGLPEVEINRLTLSLNKLQESGEWDADALRLEINDIIDFSGDYEIPGFEVPEIDLMLQDLLIEANDRNPLDDLDCAAADSTDPVTVLGDIWIADGHRVACGRAQDLAGLACATSMGTTAMIITDPPYNVPVNGHVSTVAGRHAEFAQASGEMSPDEFVAFLVACLSPSIASLQPGGIAYVFMDWRHQGELLAAIRELGLGAINLAVWVKAAAGMGGLYRSQHELVYVLRKPGAPYRNNVELGRYGRNRSNVWEYGGATSGKTEEDDFSVHPTVKPVAMIRDAILDVSAPGEVVIDSFLGSGSTLIAAETAHRRCLGVEIEPVYVDLALRRWMSLTGREVRHAATGETFAQVAERRSIKLLPAPNEEEADA